MGNYDRKKLNAHTPIDERVLEIKDAFTWVRKTLLKNLLILSAKRKRPCIKGQPMEKRRDPRG
jgi:hypothetical protein